MNIEKWIDSNTIHKLYAGSRLYGTAREDSDWDLRGVCLMPAEVLLGLTRFDQYQTNEPDTTIYGLSRFFSLALDANPNILDILCAPPVTWLVADNLYWGQVYSNRHLFLSQKLRHTFSGYAVAQLKRIQGHRQWLEHPPSHQPTVEEFGGRLLHDGKGGQKAAFHNDVQRGRWEKAKGNWVQYQTWLQERNPKRAELERRYGYDTKHASHLVRLMLQVQDILTNGDYDPRLTGQNLAAVKAVLGGEWSYEFLLGWAVGADDLVKSMPSVLPHKPDRDEAESLLMALNETSMGYTGG